jgi:hypothetical protein
MIQEFSCSDTVFYTDEQFCCRVAFQKKIISTQRDNSLIHLTVKSKFYKMKTIKLTTLVFYLVLTSYSCKDKIQDTYMVNEPVYLSYADLRS